MNILRNIYYDPSTGFQSKKKLYEVAKEKGITKQQVDYFLNSQEVYQLHKKQKYQNITILSYLNFQMRCSKLIY